MPKGVYDRTPRIKPLETRFFEKTFIPNDPEGCWLWKAARSSFGHGQLYRGSAKSGGRRVIMAHRLSWELHNGPIPEDMCVCHKCDVPWCVNPKHLFLGSKMDNTRDMLNKRRVSHGEQHPISKLTAGQVRAIRECDLPQKQIASLCGVSQPTISFIKNGKRWSYTG